jgi:hypothetical protein
MMTCKEVSTLVSSGRLADAPMTSRLGARLHLMMCRHCRAFARQLEAIARAARAAGLQFEREPAAGFESRILSSYLAR